MSVGGGGGGGAVFSLARETAAARPGTAGGALRPASARAGPPGAEFVEPATKAASQNARKRANAKAKEAGADS